MIGSPEISQAFNADGKSNAVAYLEDTTVDTTGSLTVQATSGAALTAGVDNRTSTSASSALRVASGLSFGAVLTSNKVSSSAEAYIQFTTTPNLRDDAASLTMTKRRASAETA